MFKTRVENMANLRMRASEQKSAANKSNPISKLDPVEQQLFLAYKRAADQTSDPEALFLVGECYAAGIGVEASFKEFERYTAKAAEKGVLKARLALGMMYFDNIKDIRDDRQIEKKIYQLFHQAAQSKDPVALMHLGRCFDLGMGVSRDLDKAISYYRLAEEAGNSYAYYYHALLILDERIPSDKKNAIPLLLKAIALDNNPKALFQLGACFANGEGIHQSKLLTLHYFRKAARQDMGFACYNLGINTNDLLVFTDEEKAKLKSWSESGLDPSFAYDASLDEVMKLELNGEQEKIYWLQKAADLGIAIAYSALADIYFKKGLQLGGKLEALEFLVKAQECRAAAEKGNHHRDYTDMPIISYKRRGNQFFLDDVPESRKLAIQKKLKNTNFLTLENSVNENQLAKRILNLIKKLGLTQKIKALVALYQQQERLGADFEYELRYQISKCEAHYGVSEDEIEEKRDKVTKPASKKPKTKSVSSAQDSLGEALDRDDQAALTTIFATQNDARTDYAKAVVSARAKLEEKLIDDAKITDELKRLNIQIGKEKTPILYARRGLQCLLKGDLKAARKDLFERIPSEFIKKENDIAIAIAIMRAYQADETRALEVLQNMAPTPEVAIAFAIVALKFGKLTEALPQLKKAVISNGVNTVLRDIFANVVSDHVALLIKMGQPKQALADLEAIKTQGFNHTKFKKVQMTCVMADSSNTDSKSETTPNAQAPGNDKTEQPKAAQKTKSRRKKKKALPSIEKMLSDDARIKQAAMLAASLTAASRLKTKYEKETSKEVEKKTVNQTLKQSNLIQLKLRTPGAIDAKELKKQELKDQIATVTAALKASGRLIDHDALSRDVKLPNPNLLRYSLPASAHQLAYLLETTKGVRVKVMGGINRNKAESLMDEAKSLKPMDDVDFAIDKPISLYDLRTACTQLNLPLPHQPDPKKLFYQIQVEGIKIDILYDRELFLNPAKGVLNRDYSPNALAGERIPNAANSYQIHDYTDGKALRDIALGVASPLTSPETWPEKAKAEKNSSYWVRLIRLVKLLSNGYKLKESDVPALVLMTRQLGAALKNPQIAGHFEDHLRKNLVKGHAESVFQILTELGMVGEVFPFLAGIDLTVGSANHQWIMASLQKMDRQYAAHQIDPKQPRPAVRDIYSSLLGLWLYHHFAADMVAFINQKLRDPKDLYHHVNDYFDRMEKTTNSMHSLLDKSIEESPLLQKRCLDTAESFRIPIAWSVRYQIYFRLKQAIQNKEIDLIDSRLPNLSGLGMFETSLPVVSVAAENAKLTLENELRPVMTATA